MKRRTIVVLLASFMLGLSACGGGATGSGTATDHSHPTGAEEDHAHGEFAFGEPGDPAQASETIEIVAKDAPFRFEPEDVEIAAGETVLFELVNEGGVEHELALLAEPTQAATAGHEHSTDPNATPRVEPGGTAEIAWTFTEPGEYVYECHVDGHHLAGMRGTITVTG